MRMSWRLRRHRSPAIDAPAPVHQHMGQQNQIAGEKHQQPFAARFHALHRAPGNGPIVIHSRKVRVAGVEARSVSTSPGAAPA